MQQLVEYSTIMIDMCTKCSFSYVIALLWCSCKTTTAGQLRLHKLHCCHLSGSLTAESRPALLKPCAHQ
eukprot:10641-Heterococcus_DN1.PRE.5